MSFSHILHWIGDVIHRAEAKSYGWWEQYRQPSSTQQIKWLCGSGAKATGSLILWSWGRLSLEHYHFCSTGCYYLAILGILLQLCYLFIPHSGIWTLNIHEWNSSAAFKPALEAGREHSWGGGLAQWSGWGFRLLTFPTGFFLALKKKKQKSYYVQ